MGKKTRVANQSTADVLMARHSGNKSETGKSYGVIAQELGLKRTQRAAICAVAHGDREPSRDLVERINAVYGCHLHYIPRKVQVEPCAKCGNVHVTKRCTATKSTRKPEDGVVRFARVDAARIRALSALYTSRRVAWERCDVKLVRMLNGMSG